MLYLLFELLSFSCLILLSIFIIRNSICIIYTTLCTSQCVSHSLSLPSPALLLLSLPSNLRFASTLVCVLSIQPISKADHPFQIAPIPALRTPIWMAAMLTTTTACATVLSSSTTSQPVFRMSAPVATLPLLRAMPRSSAQLL